MRTNDSLKIKSIGFSGFQSITLGLFLQEMCLIRFGAKPVAHLTSVVVAMAIAFLIYRHLEAYEPKPKSHLVATNQHKGKRFLSVTDPLSFLLLIGVGYMGTRAAASQWAMPVALYAIGLYLFPWTKITLCRKNLFTSWLIMNLGAAAGFIVGNPLHSLFLGMSAWFFWMAAIGAWFRLVLCRRDKSRAAPNPDDAAIEGSPE